jgi:hypothetical protein
MSIGEQIAWDDTVLPFQLDLSDIRGRVARLDTALERVLSRHDYPELVETLVAEACLLTAMIGQTIKLRRGIAERSCARPTQRRRKRSVARYSCQHGMEAVLKRERAERPENTVFQCVKWRGFAIFGTSFI